MSIRRVLVVDDSCMYQRLLSDVINTHTLLEVVGVAANGVEALELVKSLNPDVITLDILMPEMDGIQTLIELRRHWPNVRTIMVSSLTSEGSDAALDALTLGAHEYAAKPKAVGGVGNIRDLLRNDLLPKIEALCNIESDSPFKKIKALHPLPTSKLSAKPSPPSTPRRASIHPDRPQVVVIGVSTGGPDALTKLLLQIPGDFELPICIVQHMPAEFTSKLASRLNCASELTVKEAQEGDELRPATVYIAPGNFHMVLEKVAGEGVVRLNQNPLENSCRPAVDPLFRSAASAYRDKCLGVVMTGMGQDGLRGSEVLFAAGSSIIVQDESSSVVWGMPKLVAQAGLAEEEVPLDRLAKTILARIRNPGLTGMTKLSGSLSSAENRTSYKQNKSGGQGS